MCAVIDFVCPAGQVGFTNGCGCGCLDDPEGCGGSSEGACVAGDIDCAPAYVGSCDCTCPGPAGYEGGGCEGCPRSCFGFIACLPGYLD